eukprot:30969-Pelagococcus_subviridis.AAC.2
MERPKGTTTRTGARPSPWTSSARSRRCRSARRATGTWATCGRGRPKRRRTAPWRRRLKPWTRTAAASSSTRSFTPCSRRRIDDVISRATRRLLALPLPLLLLLYNY